MKNNIHEYGTDLTCLSCKGELTELREIDEEGGDHIDYICHQCGAEHDLFTYNGKGGLHWEGRVNKFMGLPPEYKNRTAIIAKDLLFYYA